MFSGGSERLNVLPTPMMGQMLKTKLKFAEKGHRVLKKKSDVLQMKFRAVGRDLIEIRDIMGQIFKDASVLIAEAKYVIGDFSKEVFNTVQRARIKVDHSRECVAGTQLIRFDCFQTGVDEFKLTGLGRGGNFLSRIKQAYGKAVEVLVELAGLQCAFQCLDEIIRVTNQRVNALEYRYMPKLRSTIFYVNTEILEREREDFFRLKKIQKVKHKQDKERKKTIEEMQLRR